MSLVVLIHVFWIGFMPVWRSDFSRPSLLAGRLIFCEAKPAVNLFILITGYLYAGRSPRLLRLLELGFMVVFWGVVSRIVLCPLLQIPWNWKSFLTTDYWFWKAYLALFLVIPLLDCGIEALLRRWSVRVVWLFLLFLSGLPLLAVIGGPAPPISQFAVLFMIGNLERRCGDAGLHARRRSSFWGGLGVLIPALGCMLCVGLFQLAGVNVYWLVERSASPFMQGAALCWFLLFLTLPNRPIPLVLSVASKFAFDVYLVHQAPPCWKLIQHACSEVAETVDKTGYSVISFGAAVVVSLAVYAIAVAFGSARAIIFRKITGAMRRFFDSLHHRNDSLGRFCDDGMRTVPDDETLTIPHHN